MSSAKKKVVIHSIVFSPDGVSTAYLFNDIALKLQKEGLDVEILSTTPHYSINKEEIKKQNLKKKWGGLYQVSFFHGMKVYHVPQKKFKSTLLRVLGMIYWHIVTFFLGLSIKNVSLIMSPSPPLTIGMISLFIAKLKGAKCIYNVLEVHPDIIINQGKLNSKPIVWILKKIEKYVYNQSNEVSTVDETYYNTIVSRFDEPKKLSIIHNFVDTDLYKPVSPEGLDETIFPKKPDVLKLMYAGNIGHSQDWAPLIDLALSCKKESLKVEFWVIGEGSMKKWVIQKTKELGLDNVHVLGYQKRELMPTMTAYADLHFIFMTPKGQEHGFPSKVYTIMACQKPLLIVSGKNTPITNFLEGKKASFIVNEQDNSTKKNNELMSIIHDILKDKKVLEQMGHEALEIVNKTYTKEIVTEKYYQMIKRVLEA